MILCITTLTHCYKPKQVILRIPVFLENRSQSDEYIETMQLHIFAGIQTEMVLLSRV